MVDVARHYDGSAQYGGVATGPGQRTNVYAAKELLYRTRPHDILAVGCMRKKHPRKMNETIAWRRLVNDAVSTTTATEGVTPDTQSISYEDVTGTFEQRVEIYAVTDYAEAFSEDNLIKDTVDQLGDKVVRIRTAVAWSKFNAGTNVIRNDPTYTNRNQVDGPVNGGILEEASRILHNQKAETWIEVDGGSVKQGTVPVEASYLAFTSTDLHPDLRRIPGFITTAEYGNSDKIVSKYEFGAFQNIRFLCSPELGPFANAGAALGSTNMKSTGGSNIDVYTINIVGKHAWGCVDLAGQGAKGFGGIKPIIVQGASKSDPANQRSYISANWFDLFVIFNQNFAVRLEVGATANLTL